MDVQIIQNIPEQQKSRWAYSLWKFNVNNLDIWSYRKQTSFTSQKKKNRKKYNWFWKEKMLSLTKEELKSHQDPKVCCICGKRILKTLSKSINYWKVRYHCQYTDKYSGAVHSICNLKLNVLSEILVDFHNGFKLWLSFYYKRLSKQVWGKIWMSWEK